MEVTYLFIKSCFMGTENWIYTDLGFDRGINHCLGVGGGRFRSGEVNDPKPQKENINL